MKNPLGKNYYLILVLLLVVIIAVGFFFPGAKNPGGTFLLKVVLFILSFLILYLLLPLSREGLFDVSAVAAKNVPPSDTQAEEANKETEQDHNGQEIGQLFRNHTLSLLEVITAAVVGNCAGFYLRKSNGFELQAGVSGSERIEGPLWFRQSRYLQAIVDSERPIKEDKLPNGATLTGLGRMEIKSLLGAPLLVENSCLGCILVGSATAEGFGHEDQELLTQSADVILQALKIYHRGLHLEMDQEIFNVYTDLERALLQSEEEDSIVFSFVEHLKRLFAFDRFSYCLPEGNEGVVHTVYGQIDDIDRNFRFPLDEGLMGWIMKRRQSLILEDIEQGDYLRPRYHRKESSKHGLRSFVGVPLTRGDHVMGCFALEAKMPGLYNEKTRDVLASLGFLLLTSLERLQLKEYINSHMKK